MTQEEPSVKKGKGDNGENLDSNCSVVQAEEKANSANTLNIESDSKSESLAKSSIVIASSTEKSSANENGKKLDLKLSEISKLDSKLPDEIKPHKQANEHPKFSLIQFILKEGIIALFSNVKVIIHLICVACVKFFDESVVESLAS